MNATENGKSKLIRLGHDTLIFRREVQNDRFKKLNCKYFCVKNFRVIDNPDEPKWDTPLWTFCDPNGNASFGGAIWWDDLEEAQAIVDKIKIYSALDSIHERGHLYYIYREPDGNILLYEST
jgi:hypothetical protein